MNGAPASLLNVVARYLDGRVLKGTTRDFLPNRSDFHIHPEGTGAPAVSVPLALLKAVFFVKSLAGNKDHVEDNSLAGAKGQGRRVRVTFKDGEVLAGFTVGYTADRPGFFLLPADPASNNLRVFVVNAAVATVEFIAATTPAPANAAGSRPR